MSSYDGHVKTFALPPEGSNLVNPSIQKVRAKKYSYKKSALYLKTVLGPAKKSHMPSPPPPPQVRRGLSVTMNAKITVLNSQYCADAVTLSPLNYWKQILIQINTYIY